MDTQAWGEESDLAHLKATPDRPRFALGRVVATPNALERAFAHDLPLAQLIRRHWLGDWGDLDDFDRSQNELALAHGARLLSAYGTDPSRKLWIITEADRSVTTILCPEDY